VDKKTNNVGLKKEIKSTSGKGGEVAGEGGHEKKTISKREEEDEA